MSGWLSSWVSLISRGEESIEWWVGRTPSGGYPAVTAAKLVNGRIHLSVTPLSIFTLKQRVLPFRLCSTCSLVMMHGRFPSSLRI